jgi:hypothetical protein
LRLPLVLFVVGIFCLFAFVSQRDMNRLAALRTNGIEGRGVITGLRKNTSGGRRAFAIYYRFETRGRSYEGQWPVSEQYHAHASVGDAVMVTYLPGEPGNHYIGRVDEALIIGRRQNQTVGLTIAGVVCGGMLLAVLYGDKKGRSPAS